MFYYSVEVIGGVQSVFTASEKLSNGWLSINYTWAYACHIVRNKSSVVKRFFYNSYSDPSQEK